MGANATGKSTRMRAFVDHLGEEYEEYEYTFLDTKKGVAKERTVILGRLYDNGYLVLGSEAKNDAGWVCLDKAVLSKQDTRTDFYKHVMVNDDRVLHIFVEGYFNTMSPRSRPAFLRETGFDNIDCFFMFYDTVEEFIDRTESRSGATWESKGKDPYTCAGWKDNEGFKRAFAKCHDDDHNPSDGRRVIRLPIDASKDYFVRRYGFTNREVKQA
jgi:hypothetical protein